jgi:flagellar biosynthesis/type III secretory pathway protein FliH
VPSHDEVDLIPAAIVALAEPGLRDNEIDRLVKELSSMSKILDRVEQAGLAKGEQLGLAKGEQLGLAKGEQLGLAKGEQLGLAKGEQLGLAKGRNETMRQVAGALLAQGDPIEKIVGITGLSGEDVQALKAR